MEQPKRANILQRCLSPLRSMPTAPDDHTQSDPITAAKESEFETGWKPFQIEFKGGVLCVKRRRNCLAAHCRESAVLNDQWLIEPSSRRRIRFDQGRCTVGHHMHRVAADPNERNTASETTHECHNLSRPADDIISHRYETFKPAS
jgi:hypothetical protein